MIINIVLPALGHSGGMDVVYKYVEIFNKNGDDVVVYRSICSSNLYRFRYTAINKIHQIYCSFKAIQSSRHPNKNDQFVFRIKESTIRDADVIIATSWSTAYLINNLPASKGQKYYFVQDFEVWDNVEYGMGSYKLSLNKIVISTWINDCLKQSLNMGPFPIVHNGVDSNKFSNRNRIYKRYGNRITCLMLNHTLEKKGVKDGIKAFEIARKRYPNIVLKSFGTCEKCNLPEYVEYTQNPSQQELIELYSHTDIFIFPSRTEGWGLTPIEAMACRCAVVGTRTGFVLDIGIQEKNMLISEPMDIEGMANNIVRLCKDEELLQRISENGCIRVKELVWTTSAKRLHKLLEQYPQ